MSAHAQEWVTIICSGIAIVAIVASLLSVHLSRQANRNRKRAEENWKRAAEGWKRAEENWKRAAEGYRRMR